MTTKASAVLYKRDDKIVVGELHATRECAECSVGIFEGAEVVGFIDGTVEMLDEPKIGMQYALDLRNS